MLKSPKIIVPDSPKEAAIRVGRATAMLVIALGRETHKSVDNALSRIVEGSVDAARILSPHGGLTPPPGVDIKKRPGRIKPLKSQTRGVTVKGVFLR